MRIFLMILCSVFFAGCIDTTFFAPLTSEYWKKKKAVDEYGGWYIFDVELYNEVEAIEKKIRQEDRRINEIAKLYTHNGTYSVTKVAEHMKRTGDSRKIYPRILSNGCKYSGDVCSGSCVDENVKKAKKKLREFIKPIAGSGVRYGVWYHARCPDGKTIVIAMGVTARYEGTNYGLYGNTGSGFYFSEPSEIYIDSKTYKVFHLIDGEFKKVIDEKWK